MGVPVPAQAWLTLIVGSLAAIGVIASWQQKNKADRRSEWWRRVAWSFERAFSDSETQAQFGWKVLATLVRSTLATRDDFDIVQAISEHTSLLNSGEDSDRGD